MDLAHRHDRPRERVCVEDHRRRHPDARREVRAYRPGEEPT